MNLILLGAPGAGKGTQAELLIEQLHIPSISTGNMLREAMANGSELGKKIKDAMDSGHLVSDELVLGILAERIANPDCNNGFIPGFRPGKPTAEFIKKVISKVLVFGAFYLSVVALLPLIVGNLVPSFANLAIGGTSVIIVVGVALDTVKALETQMLMRHYKGFLD